MKKITFLFALFIVSSVNAQLGTPLEFNWDTDITDPNNPTAIAVIAADGLTCTQTVGGVTVTVTTAAPDKLYIEDFESYGILLDESDKNVLEVGADSRVTTTTISFSEAVDVTQISAMDFVGQDYTFTPNPMGSNSPVIAPVNLWTTDFVTFGMAAINLGWNNVTSFTITTTASTAMFLDNLKVIKGTSLSTNDNVLANIKVYPNPVKDYLYLDNVKNLKSSKLYSALGQLILDTKDSKINLSSLKSGLYLLQVTTDEGSSTKRIIKE